MRVRRSSSVAWISPPPVTSQRRSPSSKRPGSMTSTSRVGSGSTAQVSGAPMSCQAVPSQRAAPTQEPVSLNPFATLYTSVPSATRPGAQKAPSLPGSSSPIHAGFSRNRHRCGCHGAASSARRQLSSPQRYPCAFSLPVTTTTCQPPSTTIAEGSCRCQLSGAMRDDMAAYSDDRGRCSCAVTQVAAAQIARAARIVVHLLIRPDPCPTCSILCDHIAPHQRAVRATFRPWQGSGQPSSAHFVPSRAGEDGAKDRRGGPERHVCVLDTRVPAVASTTQRGSSAPSAWPAVPRLFYCVYRQMRYKTVPGSRHSAGVSS